MFGELLFMPADFARGLAQTMSVPPLPARTGMLTERAMHRVDDYEMVRGRTAHAGLKGKLDCHVFRATDHRLPRGGRHARKRTGHGGSRKPAHDEITLDEVERITI
jgi:hypothetical protein